MMEAEETGWDLLKIMREHLGVVLAAGVGLAVTLRILAISGFVADTAYGILTSQGTALVVTGTAVTLFPAIPWFITVALVMHGLNGSPGPSPERRLIRWAVGITYITAMMFYPPAEVGMLAVFAVIVGLVWWFRRLARRHPRGTLEAFPPAAVDVSVRAWGHLRLVKMAVLAMAVTLGALAVVSPRPWLPAEQIKRAGGQDLVGYVVDDDGEKNLVVLRDSPRELVRVDDASSRRFCAIPDNLASQWYGESLASRMGHGKQLPSCRK